MAGPKSIQRRTPTAPRLIVLLGVTKAVMRTPGVEHGSHKGGACMMPLDYLRSWYTMGGTHFDTEARPQESCSNLLGPLPLCKQCKRTCSLVAFTPVFGPKVASSILARCSFCTSSYNSMSPNTRFSAQSARTNWGAGRAGPSRWTLGCCSQIVHFSLFECISGTCGLVAMTSA